jgi:hypothetical protein
MGPVQPRRAALACAIGALVLALAGDRARADDPEPGGATAPPARTAKVAKLPFKPTKGDSLSPADDAAVRKTLLDYLDAMKHKDFARAASYLDSATFVAAADTLVEQAANDSTPPSLIRSAMFGTPDPDSLHAWPIARLFASLMAATEAANPGALDAVAHAEIEVLAALRVEDHVVVAYQLSVPAPDPAAQPLTHVTAEKLRQIGGRWRILFQQ